MKKNIFGLVALMLAFAGLAQTPVLFSTKHFAGHSMNYAIVVTPLTNFWTDGSNIIGGTAMTFYPTNGTNLQLLLPQDYWMDIAGLGRVMKISVPDTTNTVNAAQIQSTLPAYSGTNIFLSAASFYTAAQVQEAISNAVATAANTNAVLALVTSRLTDTNAVLQEAISNALSAVAQTNSATLALMTNLLTSVTASNSISLTATGLVQVAVGSNGSATIYCTLEPGSNTVFRADGAHVSVDYYGGTITPIFSATFVDHSPAPSYVDFMLFSYPYGTTNWQIFVQDNKVGDYQGISTLSPTNTLVFWGADQGTTNLNWYGVTYPGPIYSTTNAISGIHE